MISWICGFVDEYRGLFRDCLAIGLCTGLMIGAILGVIGLLSMIGVVP